MKEIERDNIIKEYIENGKIIYESILNGDYKKGNKAGKKVRKLDGYLKENLKLAKEVLPILFNNENAKIKINAATQCLILEIYVKEAEETLTNIANNENNGIFSFEAEMTLKVWREGKLT